GSDRRVWWGCRAKINCACHVIQNKRITRDHVELNIADKQKEYTMGKLQGKNALITGASSGIGQSIAIRFAQEGANVAINYRSGPEQAQDTLRQTCAVSRNSTCMNMVIQADIAKEDQVKDMFAQVIAKLGSIDVLINNAG